MSSVVLTAIICGVTVLAILVATGLIVMLLNRIALLDKATVTALDELRNGLLPQWGLPQYEGLSYPRLGAELVNLHVYLSRLKKARDEIDNWLTAHPPIDQPGLSGVTKIRFWIQNHRHKLRQHLFEIDASLVALWLLEALIGFGLGSYYATILRIAHDAWPVVIGASILTVLFNAGVIGVYCIKSNESLTAFLDWQQQESFRQMYDQMLTDVVRQHDQIMAYWQDYQQHSHLIENVKWS